MKIIKTSKTRGEARIKLQRVRVWRVDESEGHKFKTFKSMKDSQKYIDQGSLDGNPQAPKLYPPADYQYMNPASYGNEVRDADSSICYSSSENWYKKRAKNSKGSNRSSNRGDSGQGDREDVENHSSNVNHDLLSLRRIEQSISKFSSHLNLNEPMSAEVVPESKFNSDVYRTKSKCLT